MMKMIEAGGIEVLTDHIRTPNQDNPRGYYEFERVKALPDGDTAWLDDSIGKAVKVISQLLLHLPASHTFKVLFVRRAMREILASQKRMLENRGEEADHVHDEAMALLFERHLDRVFAWMAEQANVSYLEVDYNRIVRDPLPPAREIAAFLGGDLDVEAMVSVVDPSLYRNR